ncbi:MAG: DUF167 domain-containing protein [Candidatus Nanohaloarchaeota archaeon QJJ-5]|nr:DUF167 domain-containing protein [Candidatus Nanohaloarchaeota archaeon QJJ-5]
MSQLYVKVKTDQESFGIDMSTTYPTISLTAPARQGRANAELVTQLQAVLGTEPAIVSGHTSSRKKIAVDLPRDVVLDKLASEA